MRLIDSCVAQACYAYAVGKVIQRGRHPPLLPCRLSWIGGQGTDPKEQNTQQSPTFGRNRVPQPSHS